MMAATPSRLQVTWPATCQALRPTYSAPSRPAPITAPPISGASVRSLRLPTVKPARQAAIRMTSACATCIASNATIIFGCSARMARKIEAHSEPPVPTAAMNSQP